MPYVSRGGYKLEKALETFHLDLQDKVMIDIGSINWWFLPIARFKMERNYLMH